MKMKADKVIVDALQELMKDNPDGVSFCQLYAHAFGGPAVPEKNEVVPTKEAVFKELSRICEYDQLIVRLDSGLYAAPDLDEYARDLGVFDLIKSIK